MIVAFGTGVAFLPYPQVSPMSGDKGKSKHNRSERFYVMRQTIVCTDNLENDNALIKLLQRRGILVQTVTLQELSGLQAPEEKRSIVLSTKTRDALTKTVKAFPQWCAKQGFDRILCLEAQAQDYHMESQFNNALMTIQYGDDNDVFAFEVSARFLSDDQIVAAGAPETFNLLALTRKVSQKDVTVMVAGPTGTGKEVISKYIHNHSPRNDKEFVAINCAAVPETMLESMLFGYEKGAFTGANQGSKGVFRSADGGTLLLDEVTEMPMQLQAKLLRVLQEREVTPLGSTQTIPVDVRVVATSNRDLLQAVKEGVFREDLYYRLNVFPIATKALVERPEDIIPISLALLSKHAGGLDHIPFLSNNALTTLAKHQWPGNVRELENVLQRALVLSFDENIDEHSIILDASDYDAFMAHHPINMMNQSTEAVLAEL